MDILSYEILTTIKNRLVVLEFAADIARFSFIVQKSISYLDLPQYDDYFSYSREDSLFGFSKSTVLASGIRYPKHLINTEEKCRNILSTTRDFLYRLHLDLPKNREYCLKDDPKTENLVRDSRYRHIGKITVHDNFHFSLLSCLVKLAIKRSDEKLKMIKWLVTFDAVTENARLSNPHVNFFAKYMYPEVTEYAFVKAFFKRVHLFLWIMGNDNPELLEFFLYHLRKNRINFTKNEGSITEPIEMSINLLNFLNIAAILKYQDAPRLPSRACLWFAYILFFKREDLNVESLRELEKQLSPKRYYLLLQVLFIYFSRPTDMRPAEECLSLLWSSLPDAYLSFEEIELTLITGLSSETVKDIYNFYSGVVGVYHDYVEPRPLKHLCRSTVRRTLWDSGVWIPHGIKQIGAPKNIQSFLNLET
ncbi:unnamed protein product [Larinioides sclopetarius]|uniref:SOCS box domain-containing protein n=1 Tax=Larinioides sclopetarius TaxID=280406 RepID=A0AAV2ASW9_9ARAC